MANNGKSGGGLSAAWCKAVVEPGRYTDAKGLMLIVTATGSKRWGQRLVIQGKRCDLGLGSYPQIGLAEARQVAEENQKVARAGGDPRARKRVLAASPTFKQVAEQALELRLAGLSNPKHKKQWRSTLETFAFPIFGWKKVQDVAPEDVVRAVKPIWTDKTVTATRVRERIEYVLDFAAAHKLRQGDNPARWKGNLEFHLPAPGEVARKRHHPALQLDHAGAWFKDLRRRRGMAVRALEFLTLTAARSGEVRGARWEEIDFDKALWTVPASRMKMKKEHRVPLSDEAVALLRGLHRAEGNPQIFFGERGGPLSDMSLSAVMRRMQASEAHDGAAGYVDRTSGRPAVPHGLRSTFRVWAAENGLDRDMAEIALAHKVGSDVERAYMRSDMLERRRAMMAEWARFLTTEGNELAPGLSKAHLRAVVG